MIRPDGDDYGSLSDIEILVELAKNYLSQVNPERPTLLGETLIKDFSLWLDCSLDEQDILWAIQKHEGIQNKK